MTPQNRVTALGDLSKQPAVPQSPGKTGAALRSERDAWRDRQPSVVYCLHCPGWENRGTAAETRQAALEHRAEVHPELKRVKRSRKLVWGRDGNDEARDKAVADAAKRRVTVLEEGAAVGQHAVSSSALDTRGELERAASSSSTVPLSEGSANGDSAHPPRRDDPGRASASGTDRRTSGSSPLREQPDNPYGLARHGHGYRWTREASIQAVRDYAQVVGHAPGQNASRGEPVGTLPSLSCARSLFGGWAGLVEAAGFARPAWGGTRLERA